MLNNAKILLTTPYDLNVPGGVNNQLWGLYRYLKRHTGAQIRLIGPATDPAAITADPDVMIIGRVSRLTMNGATSNLTFDLRIRNRVKDLMRTFDPDIVHFQELFAPTLNNFVLRFSRAFNVATFHTYGENRIGYTLAWPYLTYQAKRLDVRIAVSKAARGYVENLFPGDYHIVPNAIDLDGMQNTSTSLFPQDKKNILFVGRAGERRKGFHHLIEAYALLEQRQPGRYRLMVAGIGTEQWIDADPVGDIRWLGYLSDEALADAYRSCDLLCAPSTGGESFGLILLEAFARSKPVVGFRIDGYAELVGDSEAALLVEKGDVQALAAAVMRVCTDNALYDRMSRTAHNLVQQYDWSVIGKQIVALYQGDRIQAG